MNVCDGPCPAGFERRKYANNTMTACLPPVTRIARGPASAYCRDRGLSKLYRYEPSVWDEDVERVASQADRDGTNVFIALAGHRPAADECEYDSGAGGWCCRR